MKGPSGQIGCAPFDFLGFEFRWGTDRAGKPHVNNRTPRKSLKNSLQRVKLWCQENRHLRLPDLLKRLNAKLTGYYKSL
jgi:RNA-directed DNA polymerase